MAQEAQRVHDDLRARAQSRYDIPLLDPGALGLTIAGRPMSCGLVLAFRRVSRQSVRSLFEHGFTTMSLIAGKGKHRSPTLWACERDPIDTRLTELVSPAFTDEQPWREQLTGILAILAKDTAAEPVSVCVNFGATSCGIWMNPPALQRVFRLSARFEDILFRLGTAPYGKRTRHRSWETGGDWCAPLPKVLPLDPAAGPSWIRSPDGLWRWLLLSFEDTCVNTHGLMPGRPPEQATLELQYQDGTFSTARIQAAVLLFGQLVKRAVECTDQDVAELRTDRRLGYHMKSLRDPHIHEDELRDLCSFLWPDPAERQVKALVTYCVYKATTWQPEIDITRQMRGL